MIGIQVKNPLLAQNLISFYPDKLAVFEESKTFEGVITENQSVDFSGPILYLNHPEKSLNLNTPFSLKEFEEALAHLIFQPIELKFYLWQRGNRSLINKSTGKKINLTQKEAELIDFLTQSPQRSANKETILNHVWHYHEKAQTHTLTTHLFHLKQKMGENAPPLIEFKKNMYHLI